MIGVISNQHRPLSLLGSSLLSQVRWGCRGLSLAMKTSFLLIPATMNCPTRLDQKRLCPLMSSQLNYRVLITLPSMKIFKAGAPLGVVDFFTTSSIKSCTPRCRKIIVLDLRGLGSCMFQIEVFNLDASVFALYVVSDVTVIVLHSLRAYFNYFRLLSVYCITSWFMGYYVPFSSALYKSIRVIQSEQGFCGWSV